MKNSWKKALAAFVGASILMSVSLSYVEAAAMTNSNQRVAKKIVQTAGRERLGDFAPDFARYNDDILFGEVWSKNDVLSLHDRSIVTVSGLVGSGVIDSSLKYHIQSAKNNGVTKAEMAEIITQLGFYTGWPKAWAAFNMAKEVYAEPAAAAAAVTDKEKFQQEIMFPIGEPNTALRAGLPQQLAYPSRQIRRRPDADLRGRPGMVSGIRQTGGKTAARNRGQHSRQCEALAWRRGRLLDVPSGH